MNQTIKYLKYVLLVIMAFTFSQCEEEESTERVDNPAIKIEAPRSAGHGQYRLRVESGNEVSVPMTVTSTSNLKSFQVIKTVNLVVDSSFATNGVMDLLTGTAGQRLEYTFNYNPPVDDVDKLVGFTFKAEDQDGSVTEGDLTLVVTLSPRDNLPRRRWHLKSVLHVNNKTTPNKEELKDCEKDNSMLLFADGKITMDYGTDTGAGGCLFDGFNVYTGWELTEDNLQFIRTSYGIFSPTVTVVDTFAVKTLTVERFDIEQSVDLSAFGLGTDERFLYVYEAGPL